MPFSTRILVDLDRAMDAAVETSGLSPQPIIEEALREWFVARGYLDGSDPVRTAEGQVRTDR
ncbi:hypothetical protein AFB00_29865 (plasmid) [Pseudonocardia sp. HH130630-07]|nr:hypothetical protein AFB00_29865 [Pseudonocardia sp. HH130630-07]